MKLDRISSISFSFGAAMLLASACSVDAGGGRSRAVQSSEALDVAMRAATISPWMCQPAAFSTDDPVILEAIAERDFIVERESVDIEGLVTIYGFVLHNKELDLLISLDVEYLGGKCSNFTFARIAQ